MKGEAINEWVTEFKISRTFKSNIDVLKKYQLVNLKKKWRFKRKALTHTKKFTIK